MKRLKKIHIHREGTQTLIVGFLGLLILNVALFYGFGTKIPFYIVLGVSVIVYGIVVNFFRCPIRLYGKDTTKTVVAPADGKIVVVEEVEENEYFHDRRIQVSIFMSLTNVHANWYPVDGTVKLVSHRSTIVIETPEGVEILVRQIAGAMARRIVTYAIPGDACYIDEHLGFIKFGSRVDVFLPLGTDVKVALGQSTTGNQTVIAHLA